MGQNGNMDIVKVSGAAGPKNGGGRIGHMK